MVISVQPSHVQHLSDDPGADSLSYRWLVTMPVDTKAGTGGSYNDDFEFELLLSPSRCSPPPADQIIAGGLLLPFRGSRDHRDKNRKAKTKKLSLTPDRVLRWSRSTGSSSSLSTNISSSCPSRSSSASSASSSSCSSDVPLKAIRSRSAQLAPRPRSSMLRQDAKELQIKAGNLVSFSEKVVQRCLCLLVAAYRRARMLRPAAVCFATGKGRTGDLAPGRRDRMHSDALKGEKKGRRGSDGFSSAFLWCRPDIDGAVDNSIQEAIMYCKRSHGVAHNLTDPKLIRSG